MNSTLRRINDKSFKKSYSVIPGHIFLATKQTFLALLALNILIKVNIKFHQLKVFHRENKSIKHSFWKILLKNNHTKHPKIK